MKRTIHLFTNETDLFHFNALTDLKGIPTSKGKLTLSIPCEEREIELARNVFEAVVIQRDKRVKHQSQNR